MMVCSTDYGELQVTVYCVDLYVAAVIGFNDNEVSVVEDSEAIWISVQLLHGSLEGSVEVLVTPIDRTARSK